MTKLPALTSDIMSIEQTSAFFSSGEDVITKNVDVQPDQSFTHSLYDLDDFYEIERTVEEIIKGDYKRV